MDELTTQLEQAARLANECLRLSNAIEQVLRADLPSEQRKLLAFFALLLPAFPELRCSPNPETISFYEKALVKAKAALPLSVKRMAKKASGNP